MVSSPGQLACRFNRRIAIAADPPAYPRRLCTQRLFWHLVARSMHARLTVRFSGTTVAANPNSCYEPSAARAEVTALFLSRSATPHRSAAQALNGETHEHTVVIAACLPFLACAFRSPLAVNQASQVAHRLRSFPVVHAAATSAQACWQASGVWYRGVVLIGSKRKPPITVAVLPMVADGALWLACLEASCGTKRSRRVCLTLASATGIV